MNKQIVGTLFLPTQSAIALWNNEITGQLSDGMWENAYPLDHWRFWNQLDVQLGSEPHVELLDVPSVYCRKNRYNIASLYEHVGDRMLAYGRMGRVTLVYSAVHAAEYKYMPPTLEEWKDHTANRSWEYDFVNGYMEHVSEDIARMFYATTYTMGDLRKDVKAIKTAMKTVRV